MTLPSHFWLGRISHIARSLSDDDTRLRLSLFIIIRRSVCDACRMVDKNINLSPLLLTLKSLCLLVVSIIGGKEDFYFRVRLSTTQERVSWGVSGTAKKSSCYIAWSF